MGTFGDARRGQPAYSTRGRSLPSNDTKSFKAKKGVSPARSVKPPGSKTTSRHLPCHSSTPLAEAETAPRVSLQARCPIHAQVLPLPKQSDLGPSCEAGAEGCLHPPFFLVFFSLEPSPPAWNMDAVFFFLSDLIGLVLASESSSASLSAGAEGAGQGQTDGGGRENQSREGDTATGHTSLMSLICHFDRR